MIRLEHFGRDDFNDLIRWSGDDAFLLQWAGPSFTYPLDEQQLVKYIDGANDINHSDRFIFKAVNDSDTSVGHISLLVDRGNQSGRIGRVLVNPEAGRGRGIGEAMMRCVLKIGFEDMNLHRISLGVFDFNAPAIRCYEKVGFKQEGLLRHARKYKDQYWNLIEMGMLEDEWKGGEQ